MRSRFTSGSGQEVTRKLSSSDREAATRLVYDPEAPERSLRADLLESKGFTFVLYLGIAESLLIAWIAVMLAVD